MPSIRDKTLLGIDSGKAVAVTIMDAVTAELPEDLDLISVLAHRISTCNSDGNTWFGRDLHNEHGEAFDGNGRFWACGSKLCPHCLAKTSRRARKQLTSVLDEQKLMVGEHYYFLTLTMPNYGLPLLQARSLMHYAWTLFRKREWFRNCVVGGLKSEEFTLTKTGYHYHQHLLVRARFINYHSFRHHWSESLKTSFLRQNQPISFATADHMAMANVRRVGSLSEATKEVAKYITKSSSWKKLRHSDLLDVCRIARWPRMFEFFGSFRSGSVGVADPEGDSIENKTILDTKSLTDGEEEHGWRTDVHREGVAKYLDRLHDSVNRQSQLRMQQLKFHYKAAKFWRLPQKVPIDPDQTVSRIKALYEKRDKFEQYPERLVMTGPGTVTVTRDPAIVDYRER